MISLNVLDSTRILGFGYPRAARAIEAGLRRGLDPAGDPSRVAIRVGEHARLLYMPSLAGGGLGVKLVTVSADNPAAGLPMIHGIYVLFDPITFAPVRLLDGTALTTLRTPAVSVVAVRKALQRVNHPLRVVIFGIGPQGVGHLDAFHAVAIEDGDFPRVESATFVTRRDPTPLLPSRPSPEVTGLARDDPTLPEVLASADLVICASTASRPLFDSSVLGDETVVVAIGASTPEASEVDAAWCARSTVIVEDRATAVRESGEVVAALQAGAITERDLVDLSAVVTGAHDLPSGPILFTGGGMAWQDLLVAQAIVD